MPIYPKANLALIPLDTGQDPAETMTTVIGHTAVSSAHGAGPTPTGGVEWHFYVDFDGAVYQRRDTTYQADAQFDANKFAISYETWDNGDPDHTPFTQAQVDAIIALNVWAIANHPIPSHVASAWNSGGLGYHRMFEQWNKTHHSCPTDLRAQQFGAVIFPAILGAPQAPVVPPVHPPFVKPHMTGFPLPSGHWYGPPNRDNRNHSGFYGSEPGVGQVQVFLNWQANAGLKVDNKYGDITAAAVARFQANAAKLGYAIGKNDGLTGGLTWSVMQSLSNT